MAASCDGAAGREVGVVEDEQCGVPKVAPAGAKCGGAGGFPAGEPGHDASEKVVVEGADSVLAVVSGGGEEGCGSVGHGGGAVVGGGTRRHRRKASCRPLTLRSATTREERLS